MKNKIGFQDTYYDYICNAEIFQMILAVVRKEKEKKKLDIILECDTIGHMINEL